MSCQHATGCNKKNNFRNHKTCLYMSALFPFQLDSVFPPPTCSLRIDFITAIRGQHWLNKCKEMKGNSSLLSPSNTHTYARTKGAQTWTWSIMCQAFLPQWMNGPVTIGYRPSIVYWHWRLSSHAVHYPKRGRLERDPKRPLIIIPFREEKEGGQKNRYCNPVYIE